MQVYRTLLVQPMRGRFWATTGSPATPPTTGVWRLGFCDTAC